ncbi:MAG TPA: glycosyltransferase family 39 protein [Acidobacteriota bacterium]|nr:glycosyltransferase family 39 protein [Acidobacteriota bacterium]
MKMILAAILCVGFICRILSLGRRQLWTEELMQAVVVRFSSFGELVSHLREGVILPAPLDFFIQKSFVALLGESNWALRLHAVLLATLSLWFCFRIARQLFGDRVALYSTALLALYPLHYHYSQEARPIALVVLLTLISFDLVLGQVGGRDHGWKGWVVLAIVLALLLYSSLLGMLVLITQLSCLILSGGLRVKSRPAAVSGVEMGDVPDLPAANRGHVAAYVLAALGACVAFIPWLRFVWGSLAIPQASPSLSLLSLLGLIREIGDNSPFVVALLLVGVTAGIRALARHGRRQSLLWLVAWSAISLLGVLLLEIRSAHWYATHYVILAALPLVLIVGYGLSYVGERMTIMDRLPYQMSSPAIAYAVVLLLASGWIAHSHWKNEPVDWKGAAEFLSHAVREGDALSMPKTYSLLEYYAPVLEEFRADDLDPGPGLIGRGQADRRIVVCLSKLYPDPCALLRAGALKDRAWRHVDSLKGFTIYMRDK